MPEENEVTEELENNQDDTTQEDDAAFEAGFAEHSDDDQDDEFEEVPSGQTDRQAATESQDTEQQQGGEESPQAGGSQQEELTDQSDENPEVAALRAQLERVTQQFQSETGRTSALQRKINEIQKQQEQRNDPENIEVNQESIDLLKEDYPEIAEAIQSVVTQSVAQQNQAINARIQEAMAPMQQAQQQQIEALQQQALAKTHPDYESLSQSDEYWNWVDSQPDAIRQMAESEFANDVTYVLNIYKGMNAQDAQHRNNQQSEIQSKREKQLADMHGISSTKGGSSRKVIAKDDFEGGFQAYAKKAERSRSYV
jgi:hypothetical protein